MIRRLALASLFAVAIAATVPACGGGGESCTTCQPADGGTTGEGGKGGTAGTGVVTGHGGTTGSAGSTATGTGGTTGTAGTGGTAGTAGTVGTAGTTGSAGAPGTAGTMGTAGTTGTAGMTGTAGTMGTAGTTGAAGMTGTAGTTGAGGMAGGAGMTGRGGTTGTGGAAGTGGAGTAGTTGTGGMAGSAGTTGTAGRGGTTGTGGTAGGAGTTGMAGTIGTGMVVWYKLDETSGTTVADASGNARNGTVKATGTPAAAFTTTHQVGTGSINLMGAATTGGYISLPSSLNAMGATTAVTIACWVNLGVDQAWARVWDFNNTSTTGYMFLTTYQAQNTPNSVRFAITTTGNANEQVISSTGRLTTSAWHHIAVVLDTGTTYTGTLYVDGAVAGTNTAMTLRPSSIGNTTNNWIGHSAFTQDPYFGGLVDDFRVYNRALTASEITALYAVR